MRGWKRLARIITTVCILILVTISPASIMGHIVGPEIVEPEQSGWLLQEESPEVSFSTINDLERASDGLFFAGEKLHANGTQVGWFGVVGLNGSLVWDKQINTPTFTNGTGAQYNNTGCIYVVGHGAQGCTLFKVNYTGFLLWNTTFGDPGDIVNQATIIKIDGGFTPNNNGITVIGTKANGTSAFVSNFNETTGTLEFTYYPGENTIEEQDQGLAIATDPLLEGVVYLGGGLSTASGKPGVYHGFIEQLNLSTMAPNWRKVLSINSHVEITTIQVEPVYGGVITAGSMDGDAMLYPLVWWDGSDGWNERERPYLRWGGTGNEKITDAIILGEANNFLVYMTGFTTSFGNGKRDFFVLKVDFNAKLEWEKTWGVATSDTAHTITAEPGMSVFVGGNAGNRFTIVQNPSGKINPFSKFIGSDRGALIFISVVGMIGPGVFIAIVIIYRRKRRVQGLATWI
ncbi:hypothetical protein GF325_01075, partial [Candidatus Bathyarchaeota archaeon]|nr:hypothetical protein [Candidatus Bathyarchaeota archaeon]